MALLEVIHLSNLISQRGKHHRKERKAKRGNKDLVAKLVGMGADFLRVWHVALGLHNAFAAREHGKDHDADAGDPLGEPVATDEGKRKHEPEDGGRCFFAAIRIAHRFYANGHKDKTDQRIENFTKNLGKCHRLAPPPAFIIFSIFLSSIRLRTMPTRTEVTAIGMDHVAICTALTSKPCSTSVATISSVPDAPMKQFCA
jgi:hypothetical protein